MRYPSVLAAAGLLALALGAPSLQAQDWSPPSRSMPEMPTADALQGGWKSSVGGWFLSGAAPGSARAEGAGSGGKARFVRFTESMRPVATWSDRNGDGRCDLLELFRGGAPAYQLVDSDYDGTADVLRAHDGSGVRETRL